MKKRMHIPVILMAALIILIHKPPAAQAAQLSPDPVGKGSVTVYIDSSHSGGTEESYEGQLCLSKLTPKSEGQGSSNPDDYNMDNSFVPQIKTVVDNKAVFEDLPMGWYLLKEEGETPRLVRSVITIPIEDPLNEGAYIWNVEVRPKYLDPEVLVKNAVQAIPVSFIAATPVDQTNRPTPGTVLYWELQSAIPYGIDSYSLFELTDEIDSRLQYVSGSLRCFAANSAETPFEISPEYYDFDIQSGSLRISFNNRGREFLKSMYVAQSNFTPTIYIQFATSIHLSDTNQGLIPNIAQLIYIRPSSPGMSEVTHTFTAEDYGEVFSIQINKKLQTTEGAVPLQGVQFKLYLTEQDAKSKGRGINKTGTDEEWVVTSDARGNVRFNGLTEGSYWLAETGVPDGVAPSDQPFKIELAKEADGVTNYIFKKDIINQPSGGRNTPSTTNPATTKGSGGKGTSAGARTGDDFIFWKYVLIGGGAFVIAVAGLYLQRRKNHS